ncbi:MAG: phosphatase PAP2 family protein [Candidatus Pacearchaeota archaeon]
MSIYDLIKKNEIKELFLLFKNKYFYISFFILFIGISSNFFSQTYLYKSLDNGKKLPSLSDLILDNIPYYNVSWLYDWIAFFSFIIFLIYIINKKEYKKIPFFMITIGIFELIRGIFIILTPIGNPPHFNGSESIFNGFSKYELGVYPSGHTGNLTLYFLFTKGIARYTILFFSIIMIIALFLSRGHYSIDILSGILFAYAVYCFCNNYLKRFKGEI